MDTPVRPKKTSSNATAEEETTSLLISVTLALAVLLAVVAIDHAQPLRSTLNAERSNQPSLIYSAATPSQ